MNLDMASTPSSTKNCLFSHDVNIPGNNEKTQKEGTDAYFVVRKSREDHDVETINLP